jgi:hypothetical protein
MSMPDLTALQGAMARGLLTGRLDGLEHLILPGPVLPSEALAVHRNTALHGLVNALRLGCPTVDALVGESFFDQAALAFVQAHPPSSAWLTGYGGGFADFLDSYAPAADLPYLGDVARLDCAIEAVAGQAPGQDGLQLDLGAVLLSLDASLRVVALDHPALAIREALETDEDALAAIDMRPRRHAVALWRGMEGARVRPLGPLAVALLDALLTGADADAVLGSGGDLSSLQSEIFAAPFARLAAKDPLKGT